MPERDHRNYTEYDKPDDPVLAYPGRQDDIARLIMNVNSCITPNVNIARLLMTWFSCVD